MGPADVAGAALGAGGRLITWGERLLEWDLAGPLPRDLNPELRNLSAGGCLAGEAVVVQDRAGRMLRLAPPGYRAEVVDTGVELVDCLEATLLGRRGILMVHRGGQVRFYRHGRWERREIYSFYTPSYQAGLALADVDRDGLTDILCGNYWIRAPRNFDLSWRLFALNPYSEEERSATLRLALLRRGSGLEVAACQAGMVRARLGVFRRPADPRELWPELRVQGVEDLSYPKALAVADADRDGQVDLLVGEDNGPASRLLQFRGPSFRPTLLDQGIPLRALVAVDTDRDGAPELVGAGASGVYFWTRRR